MRRREFIALLSGAAIAWPSLGLTQHAEQIRRVAVLMGLTQDDPEAEPRIAAFKRELQILGWSDRNLRIDFRWSAGDAERARTYAKLRIEPHIALWSRSHPNKNPCRWVCPISRWYLCGTLRPNVSSICRN